MSLHGNDQTFTLVCFTFCVIFFATRAHASAFPNDSDTFASEEEA
jgi:hypothetical protein